MRAAGSQAEEDGALPIPRDPNDQCRPSGGHCVNLTQHHARQPSAPSSLPSGPRPCTKPNTTGVKKPPTVACPNQSPTDPRGEWGCTLWRTFGWVAPVATQPYRRTRGPDPTAERANAHTLCGTGSPARGRPAGRQAGTAHHLQRLPLDIVHGARPVQRRRNGVVVAPNQPPSVELAPDHAVAVVRQERPAGVCISSVGIAAACLWLWVLGWVLWVPKGHAF